MAFRFSYPRGLKSSLVRFHWTTLLMLALGIWALPRLLPHVGALVNVTARDRSTPVYTVRTLADSSITSQSLRGRVVLVNVWATWCLPCRAEMPALDHLQKTLGGDQFEVLALNMDTRNPEKVPQWLKENGIAALTLYTDAEGKAFQTLRKESLVTGLPTTFLVDAKGCVLGGMAGPAEWDSADALALLTSVIEAGRSK